MTARQLIDDARDSGMLSHNIAGRTPHQTMKSKLSVHIRRLGDRSVFIRTSPGRFFLRSLLPADSKEYRARALAPGPEIPGVLVVPADVLSKLRGFQGMRLRAGARLIRQLLRSGRCRYMPRLEAEHVDGYKQLLTYILVRRGPQLPAYRRGTYSRVEDYLKGSLCLGFGGHVTRTCSTRRI
jgi:HB1/ASXL restriction endonuclease-like protein with HTH domain